MTVSTTTAKSGKINLYIDGEFRFSVPASLWFESTVRDGDEITEEELAALQEAADSVFAYDAALRLLSIRAHSEKELYDKLRRKYRAASARAAIEKCRSHGFLNDEKFASLLADELVRRKHFAPKRVENELIARGVDRHIAQSAAESLDIDEKISMIDIIDKLCPADGRPDEKTKKRIVNRLLRLGYAPHDVFDAVESMGWNEDFE